MKFLRASFFFMSLAFLSGCALTNERVELQHSQQQGVNPIEGANKAPLELQVTDLRTEKRVGNKVNMNGTDTASYLATEDVAVVVRAALEQEFRTRGFQTLSTPTPTKVSVEISRFYNSFKSGFVAGEAVADLNVSVTVTHPGASSVFTKTYRAQGVEPNIQFTSANNARLALNNALKNCAELIFGDKQFLSAILSSDK